MNPIKFKEVNKTYAEDQPQYIPLPVYKTSNGEVTSCWKLSFSERLSALFHERIWLNMHTFNSPLQPVRLFAIKPEFPVTKEINKIV